MSDIAKILLVAAVVLLAGTLGYLAVFGGGPSQTLTIQRVDGEVLRIGAEGARPAEMGATLSEHEALRTLEGGRAVLGLGEESRLVLSESSTLRVLGATDDGVRVELEGGRLQATIRPGSVPVSVVAGDRVVRARDASFSVAHEDGGVTAVDATSGAVLLEGFGDATALASGQRVTAVGDDAPRVSAIPDALLLAVKWPEQARTRESTLRVDGETAPGAQVRLVSGEVEVDALADAEGRFSVEVPLDEGVNDLRIVAVDPMGEERDASWRVVRDSTGPRGQFIVPF